MDLGLGLVYVTRKDSPNEGKTQSQKKQDHNSGICVLDCMITNDTPRNPVPQCDKKQDHKSGILAVT